MSTQPMIICDTDMGLGTPGAEIDDGAALIMLLRALRQHSPIAVTTVHGNVPVADATHNTRRLLAYLDSTDIPLGKGAALPLIEDPGWFADWQSGYGTTPAWPNEPPLPTAANLIIDTVRANPGQVTLLALGPLTNLALALRLAPDIAELVKGVVAMGGSLDGATAEFNVRCDPEAAHSAWSAAWPVRLLGLNITRQMRFSRADFAALPDINGATALLKQQAPGWIARVEAQGWETGGCALHDAVAVAALLDETLFEWVETAVTVDLSQQRGVTRFTPPVPYRPTVWAATRRGNNRCRDFIWSYLSQ